MRQSRRHRRQPWSFLLHAGWRTLPWRWMPGWDQSPYPKPCSIQMLRSRSQGLCLLHGPCLHGAAPWWATGACQCWQSGKSTSAWSSGSVAYRPYRSNQGDWEGGGAKQILFLLVIFFSRARYKNTTISKKCGLTRLCMLRYRARALRCAPQGCPQAHAAGANQQLKNYNTRK